MRRASRSILVAVMAACLFVASATVASATPSKTARCENCHDAGTEATVGASLVSTSATTATYNLAMTGSAGSAWAVFDGATRIAAGTSMAEPFTVDLGKTYDIFAVDAAASTSAMKSVSSAAAVVTTPPVEPPVSLEETVAPITTSDAVASYVGDVNVKLTATDGAGSGVAYIYYSVDGARVHLFTVGAAAQTSVTIPTPKTGTATHTISFWSQDKVGNVEDRKTATLVVKLVDGPALVTVHRFRNLKSGFYLYTADPIEKANIIDTLSSTWKYEGPAYQLNTANADNSSPLWRFVNIKSGYYLYTSNPTEKANIMATLANTWKYEGVAYNVSSNPAGDPVWRFRNLRNGTYLYSGDPAEKNDIVANLSTTWLLEGPAYFLAK